MHVLFLTDFYRASATARELLGYVHWPTSSVIELMHVVARPMTPVPTTDLDESQQVPRALAELQAFGSELEAILHVSDGRMQRCAVVGDPAAMVIEHARATHPDLIVIGGPGRTELVSRQLGPFSARLVLGSVSPLLIVRTAALDRVIVGHDRWTRALLPRLPLFKGLPWRTGERVPAGARALLRETDRDPRRRMADLIVVPRTLSDAMLLQVVAGTVGSVLIPDR